MKWFLLFCLLITVPLSVRAQETGQVLADLEDIVNPTNTDKLVWLDNNTLLFEPPPEEPRRFFAYEYHVSNGEVTRVEPSPLYFIPTDERIEHYQMDTLLRDDQYNSHRSPFPVGESTVYSVMYISSLSIACGFECPDQLIMAGINGDPPREDAAPLDILMDRTYHPLDFYAAGDMRVHWAKEAQLAVVDVNNALGHSSRLYSVDLRNAGYQAKPSIYIGNISAQTSTHLHAVSANGTRVLYTTPNPYPERGETLMLWERSTFPDDAFWEIELLPQRAFAGNNSENDPFSGANFILDDNQHILALHTSGIVRIDVETNERVTLNPDINSRWVQLGVFSPDNRHIVVVTRDKEVRVIPTGID